MIRGYLIRITAASILAALIRRMAPSGGPGRAAKLGAGLLILLTAFGPLARADPVAAAERLARSGYDDPLSTGDFSRETNRLMSDLISGQAEAYILDKARALGLEVTAEVETRVEDYYPVPWRVSIRGSPTETQKTALSRVIEEELGIPAARQEW